MPHIDPNVRMAVARAAQAAKRAAEPRVRSRTVVLPQMGYQPHFKLAKPQHVLETTPNPLQDAQEPVVMQKVTKETSVNPVGVRRVVEAELDTLIEWGLPRFQQRYPRATTESVKPMLIVASRGGRFCLLRTDNACALFAAEVTAWEPELFVYEVFMVSRISVPKEVTRLYRAGMQWAIDIGACGFQYGSSTGIDIRPFAERVGFDVENQSYTKLIHRGMDVENDTELEAAE